MSCELKSCDDSAQVWRLANIAFKSQDLNEQVCSTGSSVQTCLFLN